MIMTITLYDEIESIKEISEALVKRLHILEDQVMDDLQKAVGSGNDVKLDLLVDNERTVKALVVGVEINVFGAVKLRCKRFKVDGTLGTTAQPYHVSDFVQEKEIMNIATRYEGSPLTKYLANITDKS
jgi:hypothetical protein